MSVSCPTIRSTAAGCGPTGERPLQGYIEGEYVRTQFNGITNVAKGFAQAVLANEMSSGTTPLESTIEFASRVVAPS